MNQIRVIFDSIQEIEQFVRITTCLQGDVIVATDDQLQDGKAILGLLSLGLHRPLQVRYSGSDEEFASFVERIAAYCV